MTSIRPNASRPRRGPRLRFAVDLISVAAIAAMVLLAPTTTEARRLVTISDVRVSPRADGTTVIQVTANKTFRSGDYRTYHIMQVQPRAVLRLRGVEGPYRQSEISVADGNVVRISISHNPHVDPPELSLVFDLSSHDVRIDDVHVEGQILFVRLSGGAVPPTQPPSAIHTPTRAAQPTPHATATPAPTPTRPPPPIASPTPPASAAARAKPGRSRGARRTPTAASSVGQPRPKTLYRSPVQVDTPVPAQSGGNAATVVSTIAEIVVSQRPNGATLLRMSLAEPIGARRIRHRRNPDDPRRHDFVIQGLELAEAPPAITSATPNLDGLELTQLIDNRAPELQVTLLLSSERVIVEQVALQGSHLVILLEAPPTP